MKNLFPDVVGQEAAKRKLEFYLEGHASTRIMPNLLIVAPKGHGKTYIARALAENLKRKGDVEKPKPYIDVNCSTIKNVGQLVKDLIVPHLQDKEATILLDEASELPQDVSMLFLSLLNPNKENMNRFCFGDYVIEVDFSKHTFIFATSEPHKVYHALTDRLNRVDLEDYSAQNLGEIMMKTLAGLKFEEGILERITNVLRGNARQAQKMANDISVYVKSRSIETFSIDNWKEFRSTLGIMPLGLNPTEIRLLKILAERKNVKLTALAAIMGMSRSSIQHDIELYLQKNNLISISPEGRSLTANGQSYCKIL